MNKSAADLISALVAAARGEVNPSWQLMTHPPRLRGRGWRGGVVAVRSSISARVGQELRRVMAYGVIIAPPPNEALEAAVRKLRLCSRRSISGDGSIEKIMGDPLDSSVCVCVSIHVEGWR
eukprot:COSAG01_NODE_766_length_13741_cov_16.630479_14_plen_121_part_00